MQVQPYSLTRLRIRGPHIGDVYVTIQVFHSFYRTSSRVTRIQCLLVSK
jgi:hypothetical protein